MIDNTLTKFEEAIDEEIRAYENMEDLYKLKQAILIQGKSDVLWDVDAKIVDNMKNIRNLNSKRKEVAKYLGDENFTISDVIDKAKLSNDTLAKKLTEQKVKLNVLSSSLSLYEKTNLDLIKHGLVMVGKKLNIIVNTVLPPPNQYNSNGKTIGNEKIEISSIVEEA
ncbi:MAG TPA: flagellar export chaperone FlgN [Candidatus Gastranaerophilaceae bacterium]|nr:flagellar export chaperone FlgN [Candidatus Gastranaerophilaceae bacterium]HPT41909.1 flagellar export chaperone FlgN [Candidatus Gastranaerophilaceae bacterium]